MLLLLKSEICGMSNHTSHTLISMFYELPSPVVLHPITCASFMLNYLHSCPYPSKLILQTQSVAYLLLRLCSN